MMNPKDPRLNGWKYKSFNLNDEEHASVVKMYEECSRRYGYKQKVIFMALIDLLYNDQISITQLPITKGKYHV
jgi:hypothetical protein